MDPACIKPRRNRVLLEIDETPHTFAGGELVFSRVPDREGDYRLFSQRGVALAIGPEVQDVQVGDYVILTKYNGVRLPEKDWDRRKLMLVKEDFIHLIANVDGEIQYGKAYDGKRLPSRAHNRMQIRS